MCIYFWSSSSAFVELKVPIFIQWVGQELATKQILSVEQRLNELAIPWVIIWLLKRSVLVLLLDNSAGKVEWEKQNDKKSVILF